MKLKLLPSTFDENGGYSAGQHLTSFVIDGRVALDAGSLAMAASENERRSVRDIVLTHAHLDHIAGLPLFVDDLFASLTEPIRVHATREVHEVLERDVFNWSVYPRFSELNNENGPVLEYRPFTLGSEFSIGGLKFHSIPVDHKVPSSGFIIDDGNAAIAFSGDTSSSAAFWGKVNERGDVKAVLIECAFPDRMSELAGASHHLTPATLKAELEQLHLDAKVCVINIKPMYRVEVIMELRKTLDREITIIEPVREYHF